MFLISLLILATVTLADPICETTNALVNEGYSIKIDCSGQAITITEAHYGLVNCNTASNLALDEVSGLCDGRSTCDFIANNALFGDPARGCPKEFTHCYTCATAPVVPDPEPIDGCVTEPPAVNEGYPINMNCGQDYITVSEAHYGKENCGTAHNYALPKVSSMCNGGQVCDFTANNALFGDPAPGCPKEFTYCFGCGDGIGEGCGDDTDCYGDLICCPETKTCHPAGWAPLAKVEENSNIMQLNHVNSIKHNNKYDDWYYNIIIIGVILFVLINNAFICYWCVCKNGSKTLYNVKVEEFNED